ncbi:MAG: alpha-galactosidase [Burkholderiales bacterium]|jgi:alpha-galactosidase|nr:alpha-galactosidase [Burkholderiales bacterium]
MSKIISLHGNNSSLILACNDVDLPQIVYWGDSLKLSKAEQQQLLVQLVRTVPQASLDEDVPLTLVPLWGNGGFQLNALAGCSDGKNWAPQFKKIISLDSTENSLTVCAQDEQSELELKISIVLNQWDVIEHNITLSNLATQDYQLNELWLSLPLEAQVCDMIQFHGRWIHEFQTQRNKIDQPGYVVENLKGRTSNDNPPLLIVGSNGFNQQSGNVYGFHLAWSGNHIYKVNTLSDGRKLVQFGEKLLPGEIQLETGASYSTPTLYASFSAAGLNGFSHNFHNFIRQSNKFIPHNLPYRPIHFNTWEAMYFEHNLAQISQLIERAAVIGVERFILDDGWFKGRNHERAGLGDWFIDKGKHPQGLTPIIEQVIKRGMEFGLWFEPEMVNPDSDLFRTHPEWMLQVQGYSQPLGRYQYALNLAIPEAYAYIHHCIYDLLSKNKISYIKWDMNRDLVQAGGANDIAGVHQQVLATYRLIEQLHHEFPKVEIESCASGGARADLGILRYTNRVWTSDCNDPYERQSIQRGFSYFFPSEIMGSHFGPAQAHTTNRLSTLEYRILTNFFGHLGFEQNLLELTDAECQQLAHYLKLYKQYRSLIHSGRLVRIDTIDNGQNIYGVINPAQTQALFALAQNDFPCNMIADKLRISYLNPNAMYKVKLLNAQDNTGYLMKKSLPLSTGELVISGKLIAEIGIQLPIMHPQSILLMLIEQIK